MLLRSKKLLPEMTRPVSHANVSTSADGTSERVGNPPAPSVGTQSIPSSGTSPALTSIGSTVMAQESSPAHAAVSITAPTSQALPVAGNLSTYRSMPYGMPTSLMQGLHTSPSTFSENVNVSLPQLFDLGASVLFRAPQQSLTNASLAALWQQMEDSNHEMVNQLTQQIGTIINPLIRDTNNSYQALSAQMEQIAKFFRAPPVRNTSVPQNQNAREAKIPVEVVDNQVPRNLAQQQQPVQPQAQEEPERILIMVNRHQDAYQVVMQVRRNNYLGQNNIANVVETFLAHNGFNIGLHRPNFVSALSEYVLMSELPRNWKVPKFSKFAGETNESTVEHIARYLMEQAI